MKIKELKEFLNQFDDNSEILIFSQKEDKDRPFTKYDIDINHQNQLVIDAEFFGGKNNADN